MDSTAEQNSEDVSSPFSVPLFQIKFDAADDDINAELSLSPLPTLDRSGASGLDSVTDSAVTATPNGNGLTTLHSKSSPVSAEMDSKSGLARRSSRRYVCKHCEYVTPSYSSLYSHFRHVHPRVSKNGNLLQHYKKLDASQNKHAPILYACQHCNYVTLSSRGFIVHSSKSHPKRKVNSLKQGSPITTATNKKYLEALFLSKYEPRKNKEKIRRLLSAYHPDSRVLEELPKFMSTDCILCGDKFKTSALLGQHYEVTHSHQGPKKNVSTGKYHCKMCSHKSLTRLMLYKHYAANHFMDTFYAWNVPVLESLLRQHHVSSPKKSRRPSRKFTSLLEQRDAYLPSSICWNTKQANASQTAKNSVPCIACDFSSRNLIELLDHYRSSHCRRYPRGFQMFLLRRLHLHAQSVYVAPDEARAIDEVHGAWVDKNNRIMQYFEYECTLCGSKYDWFETIRRHILASHSLMDSVVENVQRTVVSTEPASPVSLFTQCSICGFVGLSGLDNEILEHFKSEHGSDGDAVVSFTTHDAAERRCCKHCKFVGNFDSVQWHYAENHFLPVFWESLKVDVLPSRAHAICRACGHTFLDDRCLIEHYETCHFQKAVTFKISLSHKDYQCVLCTAVLYSIAGMVRHQQRCANKITFKGPSAKTERRLFCQHCCKIFINEVLLWTHVTQEHCSYADLFGVDDLPECVLECGIWDKDDSSFIEGLENGNGVMEDGSDFDNLSSSEGGSDQDGDDSKLLSDALYSNISRDDNSPPPVDTKMSEEEIELPDIVSVWSSASVSMRCKFCSFSTLDLESLTQHLTSSHEHNLTLRCFCCEKQFSAMQDCVDHHACMHGLDVNNDTAGNFLLDDVVATPSPGGVTYTCVWCGYEGFSRLVVLNHFSSHHVSNSFRKRTRRKSETYACKWCEHRTKDVPSMRAHLISGHGRIVSYHSLMDFRTDDANGVTGSSESSDDNSYASGKRAHSSTVAARPSKNVSFRLVSRCSVGDDSDFSDAELYKSTHVRCKHQSRYPYTCRFCTTAYVCATTFLKHCLKEHSQWCKVSSMPKHVTVLPDPCAIPRLVEKAGKSSASGVFPWSCELCSIEHKTFLEVQEHAQDVHNGRKVFVCRHCDYISLDEKLISEHSSCHPEPAACGMNGNDVKMNAQKTSDQEDDSTGQRSTAPSVSLLRSINSETVAARVGRKKLTPPACEVGRSLKIDEPCTPSRRRARKSIRSPAREFSGSSKTVVVKAACEERPKNGVAVYAQHIDTFGGVIRCRRCRFSCTDAQRMKVHLDTTHSPADAFLCKFCNFASGEFSSLDSHLAEFHKIERNHQLGLQVRSSPRERHVPLSDEAKQAMQEVQSRFLYTPAPCLPILKEEVVYTKNAVADDVETDHEEQLERFKCSYCGFVADSTFSLEAHMRRHEGAFLDDAQEEGSFMGYQMTKMNVVSGVFSD